MKQSSFCSEEFFDLCDLGEKPVFPHFKKKLSFPESLDHTSLRN